MSELFVTLVISLFIMLARIVDVSIGTVRIILISRGYKKIAPLLGFLEIAIWLLAMRQILSQLDNPFYFVAYCSGFALGNFFGMFIEEKLSLGLILLRVVFRNDCRQFLSHLKIRKIGYTITNAEGRTMPVVVLISVIQRKRIKHILEILEETNPGSFYTLEEVRSAKSGIFPYVSSKSVFDKTFFRKRK